MCRPVHGQANFQTIELKLGEKQKKTRSEIKKTLLIPILNFSTNSIIGLSDTVKKKQGLLY